MCVIFKGNTTFLKEYNTAVFISKHQTEDSGFFSKNKHTP